MGGRVLALDGVRGIAILLVLVAHITDSRAVLAGPAGVTLFFTLSGYLITSLLLREHRKNSRIDLVAFYIRRALRLYPAFLLAVVGTGLIFWALNDPRAEGYVGESVITLLYLRDFFMAAGLPSGVLDHSWSLAVEEQFYLVWPLILIAVLKFARHRVRLTINILAAVAMVWHFAGMVLFDQDRVYFAPDTNAFALLLGCAFAANMRKTNAGNRTWLALASAGAIVAVPLAGTYVFGDNWEVRNLMTPFIAGLAVLLIWGAPNVRLFEWAPLRFFGTISYGLYLWHEVLLSLNIPGIPMEGVWRLVAAAVSVLIAWLSYRYFEAPILKFKKRYERADVAPARRRATTPADARVS